MEKIRSLATSVVNFEIIVVKDPIAAKTRCEMCSALEYGQLPCNSLILIKLTKFHKVV